MGITKVTFEGEFGTELLQPDKAVDVLVGAGGATGGTTRNGAVGTGTAPSIPTDVRKAIIRQLDAWVRLAKFAASLSALLAVFSIAVIVALLAVMADDDVFATSRLWEFALVLFALAVFVASPLTIFVVGRPLKGVDEWSPAMPGGEGQSGQQGDQPQAGGQQQPGGEQGGQQQAGEQQAGDQPDSR